MDRINKSCEGVLTLKEKIGLFDDAPEEDIDTEAQRAFVKDIYGEISFVGTSPVDIEPKLRQVYG